MLAQGLKFFTDVPLTVAGMILFITTFTVVSVWTLFRGGAKDHYQKLSQYPLREDC